MDPSTEAVTTQPSADRAPPMARAYPPVIEQSLDEILDDLLAGQLATDALSLMALGFLFGDDPRAHVLGRHRVCGQCQAGSHPNV